MCFVSSKLWCQLGLGLQCMFFFTHICQFLDGFLYLKVEPWISIIVIVNPSPVYYNLIIIIIIIILLNYFIIVVLAFWHFLCNWNTSSIVALNMYKIFLKCKCSSHNCFFSFSFFSSKLVGNEQAIVRVMWLASFIRACSSLMFNLNPMMSLLSESHIRACSYISDPCSFLITAAYPKVHTLHKW